LSEDVQIKEDLDKENRSLRMQIDNFTETANFLENENKIKSNEINELNKDVKHLMDERADMRRKIIKDEQKIKGLQSVVIKDLKSKLTKRVNIFSLTL